jgi:hypothetical protein
MGYASPNVSVGCARLLRDRPAPVPDVNSPTNVYFIFLERVLADVVHVNFMHQANDLGYVKLHDNLVSLPLSIELTINRPSKARPWLMDRKSE